MKFRPFFHRFLSALLLLCTICVPLVTVASEKPNSRSDHWLRLRSDHFSVLTDADEKRGRQAAVRFEQMRAEFAQLLVRTRVVMGEPLDIIVLKDTEEFAKVAPPGTTIASGGFFLGGEDRDYVVLDASQPENWRAVSLDFARMLLNYNYPPTQPWFDEGFAEYFSSLRLSDTGGQIGGDPTGSFTSVLGSSAWLSIPDLFGQKSVPHKDLFPAESWILVHYLIDQNKLPETGEYFGLVENERLPAEQAIQQAYGMSAVQFADALKGYFKNFQHSAQPLAAPITADVVGFSRQDVSNIEGDALLAEMQIRVPEHKGDAVKQLNSILNEPKVDSAVAHRALAWDDMQHNHPADAVEELKKALDLDAGDMWVHYYIAVAKYRAAAAQGKLPVLGNIMLDLRAVIDADPQFAEAYNMLAMARLEGGGNNSALDAIRTAVELSPRNQTYLLDLAEIDMAAKRWDAATALLERLKSSEDSHIASEANKNLQDLPTLRKYGILPARDMGSSDTGPSSQTATSQPSEADAVARATPPLATKPDRRPVQFLKGKLLSVDCSKPPAAILTVTAKTKRIKLRTGDYKSLVLIGADEFSCGWKDRAVEVNYKASGEAGGDLVSLELQ